ncbi:MAG: isochorismatase family protein [Aliidongia sp.]
MIDSGDARVAAVLVIDLQTAMFDSNYLPPIHAADGLVERVRRVLAWARESGRKIAFIRHDGPAGDELVPGAPGWPVWPALGQAEDEPTFSKTVGDAFSEPALGAWLASFGATEVILFGAQTECCVAATVDGALSCGLAVTVVGDAHSTWDSNGETAAEIIARQNAAFEASGARVDVTGAIVAV